MTPAQLFTAEQSLLPPYQLHGSPRGAGRSSARSVVAAAGSCECRNPQPGCGCLPFCDSSTGKAVNLCRQSMANNPLCKLPGFVCFGCDLIPHSDQAEYYTCRI